jgi:hypothetical protein
MNADTIEAIIGIENEYDGVVPAALASEAAVRARASFVDKRATLIDTTQALMINDRCGCQRLSSLKRRRDEWSIRRKTSPRCGISMAADTDGVRISRKGFQLIETQRSRRAAPGGKMFTSLDKTGSRERSVENRQRRSCLHREAS